MVDYVDDRPCWFQEDFSVNLCVVCVCMYVFVVCERGAFRDGGGALSFRVVLSRR
jgi:hypothetical protein